MPRTSHPSLALVAAAALVVPGAAGQLAAPADASSAGLHLSATGALVSSAAARTDLAREPRAVHSARAARAVAARAGGTFQIRGAGDGHGLGMSQYGAMGFAEHGWHYQGILAHYYQGTTLGQVANSTVTVLIDQGSAAFRGARSANGRRLAPGATYSVTASGSRIALSSGGHAVGTFTAPLRVGGAGAGGIDVIGQGRYAGTLRFYPSGSGGVDTVNAVDLEDYVKGVIAEEMPASWSMEALEAQAVAARTYVLASGAVNSDYAVYSDTRSQMYGGLSAETAASNAAATDTAGQVVEANHQIVPTYFSASSGGHTESIQNVWLGSGAEGYLTGVADPYDDSAGNPYYRWSRALSLSAAANALSGLYRGSFEGVRVLRRGVSPRIVSAQVVGTRGSSTVSGSTLEADLGTDSTWMSFTSLTAHGSRGARGAVATTTASGSGSGSGPATGGSLSGSSGPPSASASGGAGLGDLARSPARVLSGSVFPAVRGARVEIERRDAAGAWAGIGQSVTGAGGRYATRVLEGGTYRVLYDGAAAPTITLR